MKLQICIDESGDTGYSKKSSKYFITCAVCIDRLDILRRIARDAHRRKYKKKKGNMLHAYAETNQLKNTLVKKLLNLENIHCVAYVAEKSKIQTKDIYLYATEKIATHFENKDVEIIIVSKRDTRKSYNQKVIDIYKSHNLKAIFSDPSKDKSLQIADFYSWSLYSFFEKENGIYFNKLKRHVKLI